MYIAVFRMFESFNLNTGLLKAFEKFANCVQQEKPCLLVFKFFNDDLVIYAFCQRSFEDNYIRDFYK